MNQIKNNEIINLNAQNSSEIYLTNNIESEALAVPSVTLNVLKKVRWSITKKFIMNTMYFIALSVTTGPTIKVMCKTIQKLYIMEKYTSVTNVAIKQHAVVILHITMHGYTKLKMEMKSLNL